MEPGQKAKELKLVGLTGGIGSGKSEVARTLSSLGFKVLDADQVARGLSLEGGAAYGPMVARFGTADRKLLKEMLLKDPKAKKDLEGILHPLIRSESMRLAQELAPQSKEGIVIYEASLLIESGRIKDFPNLIVVTSPTEARVKRICARDSCSPDTARTMISLQTSDEVRRSHARWVLENDGSLEDLRIKTLKMAEAILTDLG